MKPTRAWLLYSLLRIGIFAVLLGVLVALRVEPWLAAVLAAIIGLCISYLFLSRLRDGVTRSIADRRASPPADEDADAEDAETDTDAADLAAPVVHDAASSDRSVPLGGSEREGRA